MIFLMVLLYEHKLSMCYCNGYTGLAIADYLIKKGNQPKERYYKYVCLKDDLFSS